MAETKGEYGPLRGWGQPSGRSSEWYRGASRPILEEVAEAGEIGRWVGRSARRVAVAAVGGALVIAGLVLSVLPGPGLALVIAGLAVLATEFAWANSALNLAKRTAGDAGDVVKRRFRRS
ncbi:MAG: PGPGW domain-containing protein [Actinobacteria bacterium]|nr:PGPGW domain-containing protein [Actinomycetota bacterium]